MKRAPETDIARTANDNLLITLLLLRHSSIRNAQDMQQREVIAVSLQQAHDEILFRMASGGAR